MVILLNKGVVFDVIKFIDFSQDFSTIFFALDDVFTLQSINIQHSSYASTLGVQVGLANHLE